MIIMWMHTFKYYRSSVRKKFWFSSKLINFPKTLISSSSQFFLAIEKVMHVYYKKAVVREYLIFLIFMRGHSTHLRVIIGLQKFNIILYDNHVIKIYIFFIKKISRNKKIIFNILQYFFDLSCPLLWIYNNKHMDI